jgi:hypothetical protein
LPLPIHTLQLVAPEQKQRPQDVEDALGFPPAESAVHAGVITKLSGNWFHRQPVRIRKMMPSSALRWSTRGLPVLAGGS